MIDFNATTSELDNTTADMNLAGLITICAHVIADSTGEGGFGRVISTPGASFQCWMHNNTADVWRFQADWTVDGAWTWPATDGVVNAMAVSYDAGAASNLPVVRVNYAPVTVSNITAASGTYVNPAAGYLIGNNAAGTRTWDGGIEHLQVFSVVLTANEMDMALRRPGSIRRGLQLWMPMLHGSHVVDWSGNAFNGTATGLTTRAGVGGRWSPLCAGHDDTAYTQIVPKSLLPRRPSAPMRHMLVR